jgi:nucleoside-diphosphate-sugar epimerase
VWRDFPDRARLTGSVMSHPRRRERAEALVAQAPAGVLDVVADPDPTGSPSAFRTSLLGWSSVPEGSTHHVLLHDDLTLSRAFFARADRAVRALPDAAIALFAFWNSRNAAAVRLGALAGARWVSAAGEYVPTPALILPREVAVSYVYHARGRDGTWPDDVLMYRFLRAQRIPVYVAVPNLAQHDDLPSLVENDYQGLRRSACYLDDDPEDDESRRLDSGPVIPFVKHGRARCAVRIPGSRLPRWQDVAAEQYLAGLGRPVDKLEQQADRDTDAVRRSGRLDVVDPAALRAVWLTAYTMGVVHARAGRDRSAAEPGGVLDSALATLGPGGLCYVLGARALQQASDDLRTLAGNGLAAGQEPERRAARRVSATVALVGGGTRLGEYLVRGLADRGLRVVSVDPAPADGRHDDVRYVTCTGNGDLDRALRGVDVVVDAAALGGSDGFPALPAAAARAGVRRTIGFGAGPGTTTLRPGLLYGPGAPADTLLASFALRALLYRPIHVGPEADRRVQPVHVTDLVAAIAAACTAAVVADGYDICADTPITVGELADLVARTVRPVPVHRGPPGPPEGEVRCTRRARTDLGWRPTVELGYGIHTAAQWLAYENHADRDWSD